VRANIAPTQPVLSVDRDSDGDRRAIRASLGLAPAWTNLRGGPSLIDTRYDELGSSGAWKPLVRAAGRRWPCRADT
jgi:putative SOS response-associated peptidase YedK